MPMVTKSCATLPRDPRKLTGDISVRYIGTRPELKPEINTIQLTIISSSLFIKEKSISKAGTLDMAINNISIFQ